MARCDKLGAFALTEPNHGSDVVQLATRARRDGDHWVLNGAKRWTGNGAMADVVLNAPWSTSNAATSSASRWPPSSSSRTSRLHL